MATVGGMLAAAILKVVGDQIGSVIGGQITLQMNLDKDFRKMKMALESVEAVLKVAERQSMTDELTRLWLKRLTGAMYEISDMIDEFEADTQAITQPSARKFSFKKYLANMIPCLAIGPTIIMANKMKRMRDDLKVITDQHREYTLMEGTNANAPRVTDIRETSSTLETQIIGRTEERDIILASLSESMTNKITILPLYGIGGLGKTTLAKMVYNSSHFKGYSQVWVYVSQAFDLIKIGNSIVSQLSEKENESLYTGKQMIHSSLKKLLDNKNILIVLDDLWEEKKSHLEELMGMLKVGESGKVVVVVTTRSEDIAKNFFTIQPHKLAPLTDDQCWNIITQKSDIALRDGQEELHHIGEVIASKCGGVALAAQSIGHMLYSLPFNEWESVRNSDMWNLSDSEDVLASLKLSYSVMPSYLKICFAYCAIFPKGYTIVKNDLIHQWISLGFIKEANKSSTWQLGEKCIRQLLGLSFLEHSKSAMTTGVNFGNDTLFTMHDLVHDLARLVMVDEILVSSKQGNTGGSCCHFALLNDCCKPLESSKIRALRFMDCVETELHGATFSSAKSMRVLDLSECSIHKLPDSIGALKQLRYLNAPRVQDAKIPESITKLSKLIYLNLHGSPKILALPEKIGEIEGLQYLDLSCCSGIANLPKSFGKLKELVHLDLSECSCVEGISEFLGSFTQLRYLNLSCCRNIGDMPKGLGGLSKLQYLNLSFSSYLGHCHEVEFLGTLTKLEYLNLSGCQKLTKLPGDFGGLKLLLHLDLTYCCMVDNLHEALVGLANLQYLNLQDTRISLLPEDLTKLRYLNLSRLRRKAGDISYDNLFNHISSNLPDLEHLNLSSNKHIESIPDSICTMRKLHTLDLSGCFYLVEIPESIHTVDSLKFINLQGCLLLRIPQVGSGVLSLPHFVVRAGDDESSSNLVLLQPTNPVELQITALENVKSAGEARHINLMEKHNLKELRLEWTPGVGRFVDDKMLLEKLVPPSTLTKLEICGYSSVSFPAWLVGQLPNLESLVLTHITNLEQLVLGDMANLKSLVLRDMANLKSLVLTDMANLKSLVLTDMTNLEEWNTSHSSDLEHVFQTVKIHDCPMLRIRGPLPKANEWNIGCSDNLLLSWDECIVSHISASSSSPVTNMLSVTGCKVPLHQWRLLQNFPGLPSLSIHNCGNLTSSPEIAQHLSSLETLYLEDEHMEELPKWLGELRYLKNLEINSSNGVKELNENMRQLTKLESLSLGFGRSISMPHWLGELTSLKKLDIYQDGGLRSLPASIQQLTSLQEIHFTKCDALEHVVAKSEEGKMKLTHNQERECRLPTSLKNLAINGCSSIKSLPEGIQQLTNLQKINIGACPGLEEWYQLEENKMKLAHIENKDFYWSSD